MTVLRALVAVWRNLVEGRPAHAPRPEPFAPSEAALARLARQAQADALAQTFRPRLPAHLHDALDVVVWRSNETPTDSLSLMDQVSEFKTGLGVAMGRGGVPSEGDELLYRHLGELERWMDAELGHPESTQYAVIRRTVQRLGTPQPRGPEGAA